MKHCEEAEGLMAPDKDTDGFVFNHLMLRIKDPKKTLNFYSKLMGMRLVKKFDFPTMKFSLYFLGNLTDEEIANVPKDNFDRSAWTFTQKGMLEFTHNWGSENDDKVKFHDGNAEPKGFGHICLARFFHVERFWVSLQGSRPLPIRQTPMRLSAVTPQHGILICIDKLITQTQTSQKPANK